MGRLGLAGLGLVLLAACQAQGPPPASPPVPPPPSGAAEPWLGEFPAYPGARKLCQQHVLGAPGGPRSEIEWSLYATTDTPVQVVAYYAEALKQPAAPGTTRLDLAGAGGRRLAVHPRDDSYPQCGVRPLATDQTVLIVSLRTGP